MHNNLDYHKSSPENQKFDSGMDTGDVIMLLIAMDIMKDGESDLFGAINPDDTGFDMNSDNMDYDSDGFDGGSDGDFGGGGASGDD